MSKWSKVQAVNCLGSNVQWSNEQRSSGQESSLDIAHLLLEKLHFEPYTLKETFPGIPSSLGNLKSVQNDNLTT